MPGRLSVSAATSEEDCLKACAALADCNAYQIGSAADYNVASPSECWLLTTSWTLDLTSLSQWQPTGAQNGGGTIPSSVGFKIPSANIQAVKETADAAACAAACHASVDGCLSFNYGYEGLAVEVSAGKTCAADESSDTTIKVDSADSDAASLEKCNVICNGLAACQRFTHYPTSRCVYHNRADCVEEASSGAPNAGNLYKPSKSTTACHINT